MLQAVQLGEVPLARRFKPVLVWTPEDNPDEQEVWERTVSLEPAILPVSDAYDPDRSVMLNIRIPPALHERLETIRWELRASMSDIVRGILWQAMLSTSFMDVTVGGDAGEEEQA